MTWEGLGNISVGFFTGMLGGWRKTSVSAAVGLQRNN